MLGFNHEVVLEPPWDLEVTNVLDIRQRSCAPRGHLLDVIHRNVSCAGSNTDRLFYSLEGVMQHVLMSVRM